jgi:hypothetical protein
MDRTVESSPKMSTSTEIGTGDNSSHGPKESGWWIDEKHLMSSSSTSSLSNKSLGWKRMRQRGEPRTVAPPFFWSPKAWFKHELWSWRFYVWIYAALAGLVILFHLIALVAVAATHPFDENGRSTVTEGSCSRIIKTSRYAHWFFSVFGTGYLSASAYVMVSTLSDSRTKFYVLTAPVLLVGAN